MTATRTFCTPFAPAALVLLWVLALGGSAGAQDRAGAPGAAPEKAPKVFSGPQKGEKLSALKVVGVYDELAGKEIDFVGEVGDKPALIIFVHKLTRPSLGLTRMLTDYAVENWKGKLEPRIVWLDKDRSGAESYLTRARSSLNLKAPVGISLDGEEGPGAYGLNRNVALTILVARSRTVTANNALIQPSDTEAPQILAEAAAAAGEKAPTAEQLAKYNAMRMSDRGAARPARGTERGAEDPKLVGLLRRMIQKENQPEDVKKIAAEIEKHLEANEASRRDLGQRCRSVVDSKIYAEGGYGTDAAREQLKKWAKIYGGGGTKEDEAKKARI
jgi:hypothetical protein